MSNLLDSASIVLTPTAYDNGRMLSVKPIPVYGAELVTNGDFSNGTNDWEVEGFSSIIIGSYEGKQNVANINIGNTSSNSRIRQSFNYVSGKKYKVSVSVYLVSGSFRVDSSDSFVSGDFVSTSSIGSWVTLNGIINATSTGSNYIWLRGNGEISNFYVESISIKEVSSGDFDFSRNSAATRVNAQGLVENVQILSGDLVSNGDFSQEGVQEVSNGSFSQEGAELVTNGDFATDSGWTKGTGWSISGGTANALSVGSGQSLSQGTSIVASKIYRVDYTVSNFVEGGVYVRVGNSGTGTIRQENGTYTEYITQSGNTTIYFTAYSGSTTLSIDNVSVKEVGQDWIFQNGWSIGDEVAVFSGSVSSYRKLYQENILTIGKIYKLTFDIVSINLGSIKNFSQSNPTSYSTVGTKTEYFTASFDDLYLEPTTDADLSITNISVKEVGQDWTLGTGFSIGNNKAILTNGTDSTYQIFQGISGLNTKRLKVTFDISNFSGSAEIRYPLRYAITANGSYSFEGIGDFDRLQFQAKSGATTSFDITNIKIIEITDDTNLPRINYEGFSYQDSLGSEEVVNGDFATDTDWTKQSNWTIANGSANSNGSGLIYQTSVSYVDGKTYKVTFDANITSGGGTVRLGNTTSPISFTNGANEFYLQTDASNTTRYIFFQGNALVGSIDNVSVKEYLGQEVVPDSGCGSWLLEPQSTNLVTYSEDFSQFVAGNVTIEAGYSSPDGGNNAYKVTRVSGTSPSISLNTSLSSTETRTIWARTTNGTGDVNLCSYYQNTNNLFTITEEWQRFEVNGTTTSAGESNFYAVDFRGSTTITEVIIWGAMAEQQSYSTSYIPTNGAASTRLQDIANNSGNATLFNSTEGVLYVEIAAFADDGTDRKITLSDNSLNNRITFGFSRFTGNINAEVHSGGNLQTFGFGATGVDQTNNNKFALSWGGGESKFYVNGTLASSYTSVTSPIGMNVLNFSLSSGFEKMFSNTKALVVYKEALTDEQLTCLTTI